MIVGLILAFVGLLLVLKTKNYNIEAASTVIKYDWFIAYDLRLISINVKLTSIKLAMNTSLNIGRKLRKEDQETWLKIEKKIENTC